MKKTLYLKNIGKLSEAEINLEGITVICGENNTGKSTVGKALYNIYSVFNDCEKLIVKQKKTSIAKDFTKLHFDFCLALHLNEKFLFGQDNNKKICNKYAKKISLCNNLEIENILNDYIEETAKIYNISFSMSDKEKCLNWKNRAVKIIQELKSISDNEILKDVVTLETEKIFHNQAMKISATESYIKLEDSVKGILKTGFRSDDKCYEINREYSVATTDIPVYIDSHMIIDYLNDTSVKSEMFFRKFLSPSHTTVTGSGTTSRMDVIKTEKKINEIINEIDEILNGSFEMKNNSLKFKDKNLSEPLDVRNLSTGVKSMAVIERCLSLGLIKEGSTLILDEPEIHLHPEWQLKYAEYIVILQKALDLTVLITTHSPQFLRAIEVYTDKYEIMDRLNVYSIENEKIKNASYSEYGITEIYEKLSAPYDELQQMLDEKYSEDDE